MAFFDKLTNKINNMSNEIVDKTNKLSNKLQDTENNSARKRKFAEIDKKYGIGTNANILPTDDEKKQIETEYQNTVNRFKKHNALHYRSYYFDSIDNRILKDRTLFHKEYQIINYSEILSCEVNRGDFSNTNVTTKKKHGITRAVTGGILFGGAGAVVGSATGKSTSHASTDRYIDHLGLIITLKDGTAFEIEFIGAPTKASSWIAKTNYNQMIKVKGLIEAGMQRNQAKPENTSPALPADPLDQIKKLKELLDIGAITQEEFDAKKKQLLNL